jgi:hypothetical protein
MSPSPTPPLRYPPVSVLDRGILQPDETRTFVFGRSGRVSPTDYNLVIHVHNGGTYPALITVVTNVEDRAGAVLVHVSRGVAVEARETVYVGRMACAYQRDAGSTVLDEAIVLSELLCYVPNGWTPDFTTRALESPEGGK